MKDNKLKDSNLHKAILFRPTKNQQKALYRLSLIGFNKSRIIRLAID